MADSAYYHYELAFGVQSRQCPGAQQLRLHPSQSTTATLTAERLERRSLQKDPKSVAFLEIHAWIYFGQGSCAAAKMYIQQAGGH